MSLKTLKHKTIEVDGQTFRVRVVGSTVCSDIVGIDDETSQILAFATTEDEATERFIRRVREEILTEAEVVPE